MAACKNRPGCLQVSNSVHIQPRLVATSCTWQRSERLCLAARTSAVRDWSSTDVVIFVKYREVFSRTIMPNFIGHCRDSVVFAFWLGCGQKREKEEAYVRQVLNCFDSILLLTAFAPAQALMFAATVGFKLPQWWRGLSRREKCYIRGILL